MQMKLLAAGALMILAALLAVPTALGAKPGEQLDLALCDPSQNTFSTTIDNPYFPLPVGQQKVYLGKDRGETVGLRITVLSATEPFYGGSVTTRVVEELEWFDANANGVVDAGEQLIEVSYNYFAQTQDGTVCYFGENVFIYEGGVVVSNEGSWRADGQGLPGLAPGIFMPADPQPGMTFQQEVAPGIAEDQATIAQVGKNENVPAGKFENTIVIREVNPLDGSTSTKVYAPGIGLIVDKPVELIRVTG
jgi:hypothetical protein